MSILYYTVDDYLVIYLITVLLKEKAFGRKVEEAFLCITAMCGLKAWLMLLHFLYMIMYVVCFESGN